MNWNTFSQDWWYAWLGKKKTTNDQGLKRANIFSLVSLRYTENILIYLFNKQRDIRWTEQSCSLESMENWVVSISRIQSRKLQTHIDQVLEKEMATHSSILAWKLPRTEESWGTTVHGGLQELDTTEHRSGLGKKVLFMYRKFWKAPQKKMLLMSPKWSAIITYKMFLFII